MGSHHLEVLLIVAGKIQVLWTIPIFWGGWMTLLYTYIDNKFLKFCVICDDLHQTQATLLLKRKLQRKMRKWPQDSIVPLLFSFETRGLNYGNFLLLKIEFTSAL